MWIAEEARIGVIQPLNGYRFPQLEFGFNTQPSATKQTEIGLEGATSVNALKCVTCGKECTTSSQDPADPDKLNSDEQITSQHSTTITGPKDTSVACIGSQENQPVNGIEKQNYPSPLQIDTETGRWCNLQVNGVR